MQFQQLMLGTIYSIYMVSTASAITAARQTYSQTNAADGGISPFTYSLASGSTPAGTSLNTATGTVSGTPTTAGTFSYSITATDSSAHMVTNSVSGTISAVVPGSSTFTSGSGNFQVPPYNTLTVE